jgi:hypothetical protein
MAERCTCDRQAAGEELASPVAASGLTQLSVNFAE